MTALHRTRNFLRSYAFLPHRVMNRGIARLTSVRRPAWLVDRAVRAWVAKDHIALSEFEDRRFVSLDDFFLRRLRAGARPLGAGFTAPADGNLVASGPLALKRPLVVKGQRLSVDRVVNGGRHELDLREWEGGAFAVIFLTPRGYHRLHAPLDAELEEVRWIPGRYFPQNADALEHIPRIYERNERATLSFRDGQGRRFLLVMVGASLIGGIHLEHLEQKRWMTAAPTKIGRQLSRGDELGHFAFGSTVVMLLPPSFQARVVERPEVRMGETLFEV